MHLELTGVNSTEWNSLFNGQLDDVSTLDPMTGVQSSADPPMVCATDCPTMLPPMGANSQQQQQPPHLDRYGPHACSRANER